VAEGEIKTAVSSIPVSSVPPYLALLEINGGQKAGYGKR
jgi:hypothetical protein